MQNLIKILSVTVFLATPMSTAFASYTDPVCARECNERGNIERQQCLDFYGQGPDGDWCLLAAEQTIEGCYQTCVVDDTSASTTYDIKRFRHSEINVNHESA